MKLMYHDFLSSDLRYMHFLEHFFGEDSLSNPKTSVSKYIRCLCLSSFPKWNSWVLQSSPQHFDWSLISWCHRRFNGSSNLIPSRPWLKLTGTFRRTKEHKKNGIPITQLNEWTLRDSVGFWQTLSDRCLLCIFFVGCVMQEVLFLQLLSLRHLRAS